MKDTPNWQIPYPEAADNSQTWNYWEGLAERVDTVLGPSAWTTLPLQAGISELNAANRPQYLKSGRLIRLRGTIKRTDSAPWGTVTVNVAPLSGALAPEGTRQSWFCLGGGGAVGFTSVGAFVQAPWLTVITTNANTEFIGLDNIRYWSAS